MIPIKLQNKFELIQDHWSPRIVAELNDQWMKLAKVKGEFFWHSHDAEDELFYVFKGCLGINFKDKVEHIDDGEMLVIPKGVEHKPFTLNDQEIWIVLMETKTTEHTGKVEHALTQRELKWI